MWVTTKDGRQVNTDWFDKDRQIEENKKQADEKNGKLSETETKILDSLEKITKEVPNGKGTIGGKTSDLRFTIGKIMGMPFYKTGFKRSFKNKEDSAKTFKIIKLMENKGYIRLLGPEGRQDVFILDEGYRKYKEGK